MATRQDESKESTEEKKSEPGMAAMMDMCRRMSAGEMPECCAPRMRQMMPACCAPESKPAPAGKEACDEDQ